MFSTFNQRITVPDDAIVRRHSPQAPNLHYRLVFTALDETISGERRRDFYKFIAGCVRAAGGKVETIGGGDRTVWLRVRLKPTFSTNEFARRLKILSASWARRNAQANFAWRDAYEAVTLDARRNGFSSFRPAAK